MALAELHSIHREAIRLHILGSNNNEIANDLGVSAAFVSTVLNSELGRVAIMSMQEQMDREVMEVSKQLARNAQESEVFLGRIVRGEEPGVNTGLRARVCMDQLDRAGFGKITRNITVDLSGALTSDEISDIKMMGRQMVNVVNLDEDLENAS